MLRLPLAVSLRLVAFANRHTRRPASPAEAEAAVRSVRAAGRWFPGRFACLEGSLASALACLLLRRRVEWCIGARMMPYAVHAWVAVNGAPVEESHFAEHPYLTLIHV
ncbi:MULTISPECIES: lasso peptide biosynthesis B2 protein [unclassified Nocardiopsis]